MSIMKEFKAFAMRGSVMDLAVGVIIGAAFGKIVASLVDNILMPIIGILMQGIRFDALMIKVGEAEIKYGMFIGAIADFIIVAFVIFWMVKGLNRMKRKEEAAPSAPPAPTKDQVLLTEIRDLLRKPRV
ncbi:MAG TPA: large-conductance mechanosensitive channel protein MscL [Bacteroidia bacterium]|nr:large-conductance mechanosensitive channel protein MscL [Bacteroidia bacterium]